MTLNVPTEWRSALGRAAFQTDRSRNDFICSLIERALQSEFPELAKEIRSARERHKLAARMVGMKAGSLALVALVGWLTIGADDQQMRAYRGRRRELEAVESDERRQVEEWV